MLKASAIASLAVMRLEKVNSRNGSGSTKGRCGGTGPGSGASAGQPQYRLRHKQRASEDGDAIGALFAPSLAVLAIAMQRDRAADRPEGPIAFVAVLDIELLVEQAPPDTHRLAGQLGIDLVRHARDVIRAVDADQAPLRLAREGAEPIPGAHSPHAVGRQVRQPVLDARMRFGPVIAGRCSGDESREPAIGLRFGLGFVEMVERLVRFLDGAERPFDLAFRARGRPPPIRAGGMCGWTSTPRSPSRG